VTYTPRRDPVPSPNIERRPAILVLRNGRDAAVRFRDGTTYSLPAAPFIEQGIQPGQSFMLVLQYAGKKLLNARVEPFAPASNIERKATPKVQVRSVNGRLTTRQT